jgi:hypothetical protein
MYLEINTINSRNFSKLIPKSVITSYYHTFTFSSEKPKVVEPFFFTGFIDGEGSFSILVIKDNKRTLGWRIEPKFQIHLHIRDLDILLQFKQYLNDVGLIYTNRDRAIYTMSSIKDINMLINHLNKYPLLTQKQGDYLLFKQVIDLFNNKTHLTLDGIKGIVNIKASMNLGLSEKLRLEFPDVIPVDRPLTLIPPKFNPAWVAGFITAEGCFDVRITKAKVKLGQRVQIRLRISQHIRDLELMKALIQFLNAGSLYKYPNGLAIGIYIVNFKDITEKIIPLLNEYTISGVKLKDYKDWVKVHELMQKGSHLTSVALRAQV